jgi:microcin C transport system substrate-binding protein
LRLNRRDLIRSGAGATALSLLPAPIVPPLILPAHAQNAAPDAKPAWRHGLSLFGDLKYAPDFTRFEYVNPNAPKGGAARQSTIGTFDNFNIAVAGIKGSLVAGMGLIYDTLMTSALDEVSTEYGLLAESVRHPDDHSWVTYRLRASAKWHDGTPVTPDDVVFSFDILKKHSPMHAAYYRHVVRAEKSGERDVTFTFDGAGNRELPQIVGQLVILPKHWWQGANAKGEKRDIGVTTLEPPLGSGPYRIKEFSPGSTIVYQRVADYWARDLNVNVGRNNFDELRFEYFRDATVAIEVFKGDQVDWRVENSAKSWATAYDFPAVQDKRVVREEFPIRNRGGMQAFAFNLRREKFADPRLRRAINYAFDFEEMNGRLFYGQYSRINSYFEGTELAATGLPQGEELEILQSVRDKVPPEVFTTVYANPVGGNPQAVRANLREAMTILRQAGFDIQDKRLIDPKSRQPFAMEILVQDPSFERVATSVVPSFERLGIATSVRTVDQPQYENRLRNFDFDIIISSWGQSLSPGNEQRDFWGSPAAKTPGSRNLLGIENPAVDALIDRIIFARSRAELVAATRALDRVLLWNFYVVPQWTYGKERTARWDRFGRPDIMPTYGASDFPAIWWWDGEKAAKSAKRS